jgi:hypothetical protein
MCLVPLESLNAEAIGAESMYFLVANDRTYSPIASSDYQVSVKQARLVTVRTLWSP